MKGKPGTSAKKLAGPLRHAAAAGKLERVRELLATGADPNKRPIGQSTPLIAAASTGHLAVVKELLAAGADPSFAHGGKRGTTALLEAIRHHGFDVANVLIANGADVHHDWSAKAKPSPTKQSVFATSSTEMRKAKQSATLVNA
jgi:ankyrin repeat protein